MKKLILLIAVLGISSVTLAQSKVEGLGILKIGSDVSVLKQLPKLLPNLRPCAPRLVKGKVSNRSTYLIDLLPLTDSLTITAPGTGVTCFAFNIMLGFLDNKLVSIFFSTNGLLINNFNKQYGPSWTKVTNADIEAWVDDDSNIIIHSKSLTVVK